MNEPSNPEASAVLSKSNNSSEDKQPNDPCVLDIAIDSRVKPFARIADLIIMIALTGITLWRLLPVVDTLEFHRDEARWIGNSAILSAWADPLGEQWQDEGYRNQFGTIDESNRRRSQPPLAMYVLGFGFLIQGQELPAIGYWIMSQDTEWNIERGNMPSDAQVRAGRYTNVFITILTVLTIFWIGRRLTTRVGGVAGALVYAVHPLVAITGPRAWSDPTLVLTLALATLAAIRYADRPSWNRVALVGFWLGLGAATKLSPLFVAAGLGLIGIVILAIGTLGCRVRRRSVRKFGLHITTIPMVALFAFVASYPYLWTAPVTHLRRMFEFRSNSFTLQATISPDATVSSRTEAFARVGHELGARFSTSGFAIERVGEVTGLGRRTSFTQLDLILAIVGLLLLFAMAMKRGGQLTAAMTLAVLGGQSLLIMMTLKIEYARYLLPLVLTIAVLVGVAAGSAFQVVWTAVSSTKLGSRATD